MAYGHYKPELWSEEVVLSGMSAAYAFEAYCLGSGGIFSHGSKTSFLRLAFLLFSPMISWQRKLCQTANI